MLKLEGLHNLLSLGQETDWTVSIRIEQVILIHRTEDLLLPNLACSRLIAVVINPQALVIHVCKGVIIIPQRCLPYR